MTILRRFTVTLAATLGALVMAPTAHAAPVVPAPADPVRMAALATKPCVDGGPTAGDTATATELNRILTGSLAHAMDAYRVSCARAVIGAVQKHGLDERAAVIAIATTIVESTIRNVDGGDRDSVGLFQQRNTWGSVSDRLNPVWATEAFLDKMERSYPNGSWRNVGIGTVCQKVQQSAFPDRYDQQAADAQRIVDAVGGPTAATVSVYGALADGRLTYATIDAQSGDRGKTLQSANSIGFAPKTLASLNFNTLLVTDAAGMLYRVDILTNRTALTFSPPEPINDGWTHDLLTYDGHGHLYGIANGHLLQYVVSRDKPGIDQIGQRTEIGSGGFTLNTLTATGDDWLLGVSTTGLLRSYHIGADHQPEGRTIAERWGEFSQLISPGYGLYYGKSGNRMFRYFDHNPYDLSGADLQYFGDDPVDVRGWIQTVLSAVPFRG